MKVCGRVASSEKAQMMYGYKSAWRLLKKLKIDLLYDPATPECHPEDSSSQHPSDSLSSVFTASLPPVARTVTARCHIRSD